MHQPDLKQIKKWDNFHALALLIAGGISLYLQSTAFIIITAIFSFGFFIYSHHRFLSQYQPWAGYANLVTIGRLSILLTTVFLFTIFEPYILFFIFLAIIGMDVLDGYLARKYEQESDFGLYMDMESDSLFVCLVSLVLFLGDYLPFWILIVGFMRYFNVAIFFIFNLPPKKEPKRKYASYIAGFLFVAIISPFVLSYEIYLPIVALASILVTFSFTLSFLQYLKAEPI